jgi:hypothetical protein
MHLFEGIGETMPVAHAPLRVLTIGTAGLHYCSAYPFRLTTEKRGRGQASAVSESIHVRGARTFCPKERKNVIAKECHYQFALGQRAWQEDIAQRLPSRANYTAAKKIATLCLTWRLFLACITWLTVWLEMHKGWRLKERKGPMTDRAID